MLRDASGSIARLLLTNVLMPRICAQQASPNIRRNFLSLQNARIEPHPDPDLVALAGHLASSGHPMIHTERAPAHISHAGRNFDFIVEPQSDDKSGVSLDQRDCARVSEQLRYRVSRCSKPFVGRPIKPAIVVGIVHDAGGICLTPQDPVPKDILGQGNYSPSVWTTTCRALGRSSSTRKMRCHRPRCIRPLTTGTFSPALSIKCWQ